MHNNNRLQKYQSQENSLPEKMIDTIVDIVPQAKAHIRSTLTEFQKIRPRQVEALLEEYEERLKEWW